MMKQTTIFTLFFITFCLVQVGWGQNAWINEIHYDNSGGDTGEGVEVVIQTPSNYTLSDFTVTLYNGSNGTPYSSLQTLDSFTSGNTENGFTLYYKMIAGIQNGAPDGLALDYDGTLIQFLSYEGSFTASGGAADGESSTDIGVTETSSTSTGKSLQLTGNGTQYLDFTWQANLEL